MTDSISHNLQLALSRRQLLARSACSIGAVALAELLAGRASGDDASFRIAARARHVIYLFMHGDPSHVDLFDYKPELTALHASELVMDQRGGRGRSWPTQISSYPNAPSASDAPVAALPGHRRDGAACAV